MMVKKMIWTTENVNREVCISPRSFRRGRVYRCLSLVALPVVGVELVIGLREIPEGGESVGWGYLSRFGSNPARPRAASPYFGDHPSPFDSHSKTEFTECLCCIT